MHQGLACFMPFFFNPLNAKLNPICHLLALLGAHHILHVSRIRVNSTCQFTQLHLQCSALSLIYVHLSKPLCLWEYNFWFTSTFSETQLGSNSEPWCVKFIKKTKKCIGFMNVIPSHGNH